MPVAIVTGASRGFGRALALDLAKDHWSLVIDGRRARELNEIKETLKRLGTNVSAIVGDVTDPNHRAVLIEAAKSFGALDLLVNNASTLGPSPLPRLEDYPLDELRRVYEVNTVAAPRSDSSVPSAASSISRHGSDGFLGRRRRSVRRLGRLRFIQSRDRPIESSAGR